MKKINRVFLAVLFLNCCSYVTGQNSAKPFSSVSIQDSKYANVFIYLHTDRSYYLPGESVFLKAFFLDNLNNRSYPPDDTLHISLLDQEGIEVSSGIFPVTNNLIDGKIELPDFLAEGNYILVAFSRKTNWRSPEKMFSRIVEIRKSVKPDLITDLSLKDSTYEPGSLLTAQIKFSGRDNKPVTQGFTYLLTGVSGEILNGKGKANNEGLATLTFKLPEFDKKEDLKLFVTPSYKNTKTITGVVIPTRDNYTGGKQFKVSNLPSNEFKHLNIRLNTVSLSNEKSDKFRLDISVTDEDGVPVMANLSVSVSNIIPGQLSFENDNIVSYITLKRTPTENVKNADIKQYFAQYLLQKTRLPGSQFIVQEKNDPRKLRKKHEPVNQKKQDGYSSDRNIFDILMSIKPYHIDNGKITFGINTVNSINNQDGALIIVDGIKMGTDPSILNSIPVPDIARITASTNVMDIQRYSGLNNVGIIEIFMKKNKDFIKNEETADLAKSSTLFWGPAIMTDSSGKASATFFNNNNSPEILISVEGIAANGLCGSSTICYKVK